MQIYNWIFFFSVEKEKILPDSIRAPTNQLKLFCLLSGCRLPRVEEVSRVEEEEESSRRNMPPPRRTCCHSSSSLSLHNKSTSTCPSSTKTTSTSRRTTTAWTTSSWRTVALTVLVVLFAFSLRVAGNNRHITSVLTFPPPSLSL